MDNPIINTTLKQTIIPQNDKMLEKFLKIHKNLFYTDLTTDEILVYAYLRDKRELSVYKKNNGDTRYFDTISCDFFCLASNQELMNFMKIKGTQKILRIKKNLEINGLIKQERQFDNTNKIFVYDYNFESVEK